MLRVDTNPLGSWVASGLVVRLLVLEVEPQTTQMDVQGRNISGPTALAAPEDAVSEC